MCWAPRVHDDMMGLVKVIARPIGLKGPYLYSWLPFYYYYYYWRTISSPHTKSVGEDTPLGHRKPPFLAAMVRLRSSPSPDATLILVFFNLSISLFFFFFLFFFLLRCVVCEQPQGDHIELHQKRHGFRPDHFERKRKKEAREVHKRSAFAQKVRAFAKNYDFFFHSILLSFGPWIFIFIFTMKIPACWNKYRYVFVGCRSSLLCSWMIL